MSHATLQTKQPLKHQNVGDRKTAPSFDASAIAGFQSIYRVGGSEVKLIIISRSGALIESPELLSMGSSITLQIVTAEEVHMVKGQIIGRTINYRISSSNKKTLHCEAVIAFDKDFTILPASAD